MRHLAIVVLVCALPAFAADKEVKPVLEVGGFFRDNNDLPKMKAIPAGGVLADEKSFTKLWTSWKGETAPRPKVDFPKQFVYVVATECAANRIGGGFALTDKGDLKPQQFFTEIAGPGFVYKLYVLDREGVKSVNGKALP